VEPGIGPQDLSKNRPRRPPAELAAPASSRPRQHYLLDLP
jgi:hypothetical protein